MARRYTIRQIKPQSPPKISGSPNRRLGGLDGDELTKKLLTAGIVGAITAGLCCVTPILPWLLGTVGLSGLVGYVYWDDVMLPHMALFLALAGYALWRRKWAK